MAQEEDKATAEKKRATGSRKRDIGTTQQSVLKEMKYGTGIGDFMPAGLMEKCKCYKNFDLYMSFIKSNELRLRQISADARVKEALQILKKSDGDRFDGGVVLGLQNHPIEKGTKIFRLFTCDGKLVAASVTESAIEQYWRDHPSNCSDGKNTPPN